MRLSIVIVSYKVKNFLHQCLLSVQESIEGMDADVWVIDNDSKDDTIDALKPIFPSVHFVRNESNEGFSKANNRIIRQTQSKYVLLLNPDTIVSGEAIRSCVQWMEEHPNSGAVGPSLHNADGRFARESQRGIPTPLVSFCKMSGLIKLFPHHRAIGRYYMCAPNKQKPAKVEILSGSYMMLRRAALDQVGLLDEDYFMYGEDIDLSYRLVCSGWKNYYLPVPIIHYRGESAHESTLRYVNVFHKAMIIFYEKHFSKKYFLSGLLIRLAVYLKAALTFIVHIFRRLRAHILPNQPCEVYCFCDEANKSAIAEAVAQIGRKIHFIGREDLTKPARRDALLLLDHTAMNYDKMVRCITEQTGKHRYLIATYHPSIGLLLP
ncbi:MAG: glycosyltransferase family 2 protein [Bacteroidales bacterium]|nr:glycosyltransferase family 2 protein [Candidatus Physcousia equi]